MKARLSVATLALFAGCLPMATAGPNVATGNGPPLHVSTEKLSAAVTCSNRVNKTNRRQTVVLIHGTAATPDEAWGWGYEPALDAAGYGVCTVRLPRRALVDLTISAQYAVFAAREAYRLSGRRISIVGHSQGGLLAMWIARFWPDVAQHARDVVSLAGPLHGSRLGNMLCATGRCATVAWQQSSGSRLVSALNRGSMPPAADYTSIASKFDEVVFPQPLASERRGVHTIMLQDICPGRVVEHASILADAVAYALVLDALGREGPASATRLPADVCQQLVLPNLDPIGAAGFAMTSANFVTGLLNPLVWVEQEPPLPRYAHHHRGVQ